MTRRRQSQEQEAWDEYYRQISQYERWSKVSGELSRFLEMLNRYLRETKGIEQELYLEVKKTSELVQELVKKGTSRYCERKPSKPYPRPYGNI